jgi:hypothetical protein
MGNAEIGRRQITDIWRRNSERGMRNDVKRSWEAEAKKSVAPNLIPLTAEGLLDDPNEHDLEKINV